MILCQFNVENNTCRIYKHDNRICLIISITLYVKANFVVSYDFNEICEQNINFNTTTPRVIESNVNNFARIIG